MKRVFSIFMGLVIAVLCLYSFNEQQRKATQVASMEVFAGDTIIQHVKTALEDSSY